MKRDVHHLGIKYSAKPYGWTNGRAQESLILEIGVRLLFFFVFF